MINLEEFIVKLIAERKFKLESDVQTACDRLEKLADRYSISPDTLCIALHNFPELMNIHPIIVDKKFEYLNKSLDLNQAEFGKIITLYPSILNFSNSDLSEKISSIRYPLHLYKQEMKKFMIETPTLLAEPSQDIINRFDFLASYKLNRRFLASHPKLLMLSPKEISWKFAICDYFDLNLYEFIHEGVYLMDEKRIFARAPFANKRIHIISTTKEIFESLTNKSESLLMEFLPMPDDFEQFYKKHHLKRLERFKEYLKQKEEREVKLKEEDDGEKPAEI